MLVFDIGANIGLRSLANVDSYDKIISIEAVPAVFSKLQDNCKNSRIVCLNYAVCNSNSDDVVFYECVNDVLSTLNKDWLASPSSRFHHHPSAYKAITCKAITLDRLIEMHGLPSLIKIDVEGGEYECISSLTHKVDLLCFEWASEVNDITFKCLDYLLSIGFKKFSIQDGDCYTYRPLENKYYDMTDTKSKLSNTKPKEDWGMIWCK